MNSRTKMRLFMVYCFFSTICANGNVTEFLNSTEPTTVTEAITLPVDNETDSSNFISNENSAHLVHFTKFNWTVVDGVDNSFSGTAGEHEIENATQSESTVNKSRTGHERNLMVVLPVMQGNSDLSNSNLQILYTKPPVTAIIGGERKEEHKPEQRVRTTIKMVVNKETMTTTTEAALNELERIDRIDDFVEEEPKRQHFTDFTTNKSNFKSKSPLDYGYPDTFKFIEDFNELPKNHRPAWAIPDGGSTAITKKSSSFGVTRRDPFQMFESVKPLEINKLLSFKPIPVTDSIADTFHKKKNQLLDLSTELPIRPISKRPTKRPKKPQKTKTTTIKYMPQSLDFITQSTISSPSVEDMYTAARYTTLMSKTASAFLPTPWREINERTVETTTPKANTLETSTITSTLPETTKLETKPTTMTTTTVATTRTTRTTTTTTTTTTTPAPTTTPITTTQTRPTVTTSTTTTTTTAPPASTTECKPDHKKQQINPSDLINLKKILDEEFGGWPKLTTTTTTEAIKVQNTPSSPFTGDLLTSDMRNMLLALGILKADNPVKETITTTVAYNNLEELFKKREPSSPHIDPNSYLSFKKIPIDQEKQNTRLPVSDDMKELLASFGLLPKNTNHLRISRKRKYVVNETRNVTDPEILEKIIPLPFNYKPHEKGHVFHPTVHLENLGDHKKIRQINDVIDTIKKLSKKDANTSVEEIEEHLERIVSLIKEENVSKDPFLKEVTGMIKRTKAKLKHLDSKTIDSEINYKPDESVIVKTYTRSNHTNLNLVMNPPNPLSSEELQQLLETNKNEVKRQQPSNVTSNSAPISELAASFGGGEVASEPPPNDVTTGKPNGLYFWVDWNTFLNVGEAEKNPIRVRFNPRAGNPRNFLPVTVP